MSENSTLTALTVALFGVVAWYILTPYSASPSEVREYLNNRQDFAKYRIIEPAICKKNKTGSDEWGQLFEGVNFDGSIFQAVVCPVRGHNMVRVPNQPYDPLNVQADYEYLAFPPKDFEIRHIKPAPQRLEEYMK